MAQEPAFRDGKTWCGDPLAAQSPDNPYVQLAERNATRALSTNKEPFWLAWAFAAPESKRRGDEAMKSAAITAFEELIPKQAAKKTVYWDLLGSLEAIHLLRRAEAFPKDKLDQWLTTLKPCVEANFQQNTTGTDWTTRAPNTLHQSAAILQLASILYGEPRYAELAAALVRRASGEQTADGAYRYLPRSGPSQVYFGFDATFLGRYYQLSRDPAARKQLVRMSGYAKDALASGLMETASAPWWKHSFVNGGPMHGVEIVAGLTRDPVVRALAEQRLPLDQPYLYSYYPQFFWDPAIAKGTLGEDLCRFNANFDGPQLRAGVWQVVMPSSGFADTFVGATMASGAERFKFAGQLGVAGIAIRDRDVSDPQARPGAAMIAAPDDLHAVSLVGDGWIASAVTFAPRPYYFGDVTPPRAVPWRVAQVWFADRTMLAGWITATPTSDTAVINGPVGFLQFDHPPQIDQRTVTSGALTVMIAGKQVDRLNAGKVAKSLEISLSNATERSYRARERWGFGLTCAPSTTGVPSVTDAANDGPLVNVDIDQPNGNRVTLIYNPTDRPHPIDIDPATYRVWVASTRNQQAATRPNDGESPTTRTIAPGHLMVVQPNAVRQPND